MDKDIKQIQQEFEKKEEQERAMKNVTCPKLANTLVKLQQVYNEFYEEYDRAYDLGVRDKNDKMESDFTTSFDNMQGVIATLMANLLQSDLYRAVPYEVQSEQYQIYISSLTYCGRRGFVLWRIQDV